MEVRFMRNGLCGLQWFMRRLNRFAALLLVIAILFSASSIYAKPKKKTQTRTQTQAEEIHAASGMVVITAKGKKYHKPGCRTVKKTYKILTVEEARSKGYTPCKVCGAE